jgi:DNA-binding LacI/PurR family transcriptional regulator
MNKPLAGPVKWMEAQLRMQAWRETVQAHGASAPPPLVGDWSARSGYELGRRLSAEPSATAVFVANDQMALGVLRALHEAGRRIPEDVSVVGFDDIPEAPYFMPPLTTVRQDFGELGSRSLRALVQAIETFATGESPPVQSLIPPELIVRSSTAAASEPPPRPNPDAGPWFSALTRLECDR